MDLNQTCRTCFQQFENSRSVDLFKRIDIENESEILQLSVMLELLTGLQFCDDGHDLPDRLCFECVRQICESFYFRQKCIETDVQVRAKLAQVVVEAVNFEGIECDDDFYWNDPTSRWDDDDGENDETVANEIELENLFGGENLSDVDASMGLERSEHKCKYCGKYYNTVSFMKKHINSKHAALIRDNEIEFEYTCNECGQNYTNYTNIRLHTKHKHPEYFKTRFKLEVKDNKYMYLCEFCGKGYKCPKILNIHIRNHTGEKPYKCDICAKDFTSEPFLRDHMRRHTDTKSQICAVCNKGFTRKKYLDLHVKLHDDNQMFECHICSKRYVGRGRLVFHLRYHSRLNHQKGGLPISLNKSYISSLKPIAVDESEKLIEFQHEEEEDEELNH